MIKFEQGHNLQHSLSIVFRSPPTYVAKARDLLMIRILACLLAVMLLLWPQFALAWGNSMQSVDKNLIKITEECRKIIYSEPGFSAVTGKLPPIYKDEVPSINVLTNQFYPTASEVTALSYLGEILHKCNQFILDEVSKLGAEWRDLYSKAQWEGLQVFMKLIKREITYGEHARIGEETRQRFKSIAVQLINRTGQAQYQSQQNGLQNLVNWMQATQPRPAAPPAPIGITQCRWIGQTMHCTSQ